jgi:hypothetical protein
MLKKGFLKMPKDLAHKRSERFYGCRYPSLRSLVLLACIGSFVIFIRPNLTAATSVWSSTTVPGLVDGGTDNPVELGFKFRSDVEGAITGIRLYKAAANTGTHVGNLWTSTGVLLGSVTSSGETASGWQQMNFANPIQITPNTVYIASYHCNNGHYSADVNYFATAGIDNPPLHALATGVSGPNGVYVYGSGSAFPNLTWNAANYWVDVVFQAGPPPPDTTPPTVSSANPAAGAARISLGSSVLVTFSESMNSATINNATITLRDASAALVPATVAYNTTTHVATLTPSSALAQNTTYTATVKGGAGGVADVAGNPMTADFAWSFTTIIPFSYGGGPGGPILVISDARNAFSQYYAEILLTEGLNEFAIKDISTVTSTVVAQYDVVVLAQIALTSAQVTMLIDWVNAGGKLIAMRPDKQLAGLLGLTDAGATLSNAYLLVNTSSGPGFGIVNQTMQFHGAADRYTLSGASSIATLYSSASTATANPAVTLRSVGSNGGQVAAFTYDLAKSIVYTRQGNPSWAGQERDGITPIRSDDLFYGGASFDPQPDWVDLNKVAIPQADEQQRLLANMILSMESDKKLLPRFWYFPDANRAVIVMTGDDHATGGTSGRFDHYKAISPANSSVADWDAVRSTSYVYPGTPLTDAQAAAYNAQGFEIALHLTTGCADYTRDSLTAMFNDQIAQFRAAWPSLPSMTTHRIHCIAWSDYTMPAEVELSLGIRLDVNYYYWPQSWIQNRPGLFTGSGIPMRFATSDGNVLDIYQAPSQMTDESGQTFPFTVDTLLNRALGSEGSYGAFVANMHTDFISSSGSDAITSSAISRGVPIISARQLLTWLDGRNASSIQSITWNTSTKTATFSVSADPGARNIVCIMPIPAGFNVSGITFNGSAIAIATSVIKGINYALFSAPSGNYQVSLVLDSTPPTVVSVNPTAGQPGVGIGSALTVIFDEGMSPATINANTILLRDSAGNSVSGAVSYNPPSSTATFTPSVALGFSKTYTATVKGGIAGVTDAAGNPLAADFVWSFTTVSSITTSIWSGSTVPGSPDGGPDTSVELGVKFKSDIAGTITGIRFYKSPANTGTHTAHLWSSTGTSLATATFSGETASGWQQVNFATPVAITVGTTYVASYHCAGGHYSADVSYFLSSGVDNPPLHALPNSTSVNGVYRYGAAAFPNSTWNAANYWVDVVFKAP